MGSTVLLGDSSSHGNVVLEGSDRTLVGGTPLSYVPAAVSGDPIPYHYPNNIVSSGNGGKTLVGGKVVASSGAMTACGASIGGSGSRTIICS